MSCFWTLQDVPLTYILSALLNSKLFLFAITNWRISTDSTDAVNRAERVQGRNINLKIALQK